jgi:hypothetical protein
MKRRGTIFLAKVGPVRILQKPCRGRLRRTCVFAFDGICGSHSAFYYIRGAKRRHTIFNHGWDRCGFHKKRVGT